MGAARGVSGSINARPVLGSISGCARVHACMCACVCMYVCCVCVCMCAVCVCVCTCLCMLCVCFVCWSVCVCAVCACLPACACLPGLGLLDARPTEGCLLLGGRACTAGTPYGAEQGLCSFLCRHWHNRIESLGAQHAVPCASPPFSPCCSVPPYRTP